MELKPGSTFCHEGEKYEVVAVNGDLVHAKGPDNLIESLSLEDIDHQDRIRSVVVSFSDNDLERLFELVGKIVLIKQQDIGSSY